MTFIVGIDPGIAGAIGVIDSGGQFIAVHDMPIVKMGSGNQVDSCALHVLLGQYSAQISMCQVEEQSPMPKNGVVASFRLGRNYQAITTLLDVMGIPWREIRPAKWKKRRGVTKDKNSSLVMARRLWPAAPLDRKKDDGRAEALLIAEDARGMNHAAK